MNKKFNLNIFKNGHLDIYSKLSAEEILKWLYEANKFISKTVKQNNTADK
jgi:hypothetical protein